MAQSLADYCTLVDASEKFKVSVSTLRIHIRAKGLPAVKILGRVNVANEDLEKHFAPKPIATKQETADDWVQRMLDKAPPLNAEQRDAIVSAFAPAIEGNTDHNGFRLD